DLVHPTTHAGIGLSLNFPHEPAVILITESGGMEGTQGRPPPGIVIVNGHSLGAKEDRTILAHHLDLNPEFPSWVLASWSLAAATSPSTSGRTVSFNISQACFLKHDVGLEGIGGGQQFVVAAEILFL